jgi:tol-pal system protein YbgF
VRVRLPNYHNLWDTRGIEIVYFRESTMKRNRVLAVLAMFSTIWLGVSPAWGVSKEMVQLQTQVQQLQEQMTAMQRSFDERMGVMKDLVEKDTDGVNKVAVALNSLQATLAKQQGDSGTRTDQISGQIQALNDTLDELKTRLAKVTKQLEDMQSSQQSLAAQQATAQAQQQAQAQAPPPDVLYNNALRDYNGNKNDLALQEFSDYIKFYPNTDLAGNCYYYLGELQFRQGNYQQAAESYDQVLQNFPSGNKAASAQLKKGFSLIELGKQDDGVSELRHLVQRYPHSPEALQARDRLHKLGVSTTGK